ncbi:hypothetical protein DPX16_3405 [Anabarilius grahami]|uniref:Uncharacterized protein n=1 Tax=Anabarilius grahami TaxID=495550 RepID=A0A3N0XNC7_ANAGA|nr:hypothetical protein DPX16_3405 [Anabarilius grahami]
MAHKAKELKTKHAERMTNQQEEYNVRQRALKKAPWAYNLSRHVASARGSVIEVQARQTDYKAAARRKKRIPKTQQLTYPAARGALAIGRGDIKHGRHHHPTHNLVSPGEAERNIILSDFPTSSPASPMLAAVVLPQHTRGYKNQAQMQTPPSGRVSNENGASQQERRSQ